MARWWCDGWSMKGSMVVPTTAEAGQTTKIEGTNERSKEEGGLRF